MYDIPDYGRMIAFKERTAAYARALETRVVPDSAVLDIGTGSGILALLACRAGARKVYAVESEDIIELARETARDNGFSDRIEFIHGLSTQVSLPERIDGIVAEIHGLLPLYGISLASLIDARERLLKPGGWIIPERETVRASLVSCPQIHRELTAMWNTEYGFEFAGARERVCNSLLRVRIDEVNLATEHKEWVRLDYRKIASPNIDGALSWSIDRATTIHGLCLWYDCETAAGLGFSNAPGLANAYASKHAFFPLPEAAALSPGDTVGVALRADLVGSDYVWSWNTRVIDKSGTVRRHHNQSTFMGTLIGRRKMQRRSEAFVADPGEEWAVDKSAMGLMQARASLGEIATALFAQYPGRFKTWNEALTKAADLAERYSK
ncbi:MAG TPA: 50S ribosomal protein L11 methyltransferase [Candidatus Binataceae bacterium]|nr:50S ribosomal protein L11 methyltransferase [Candidatus Binataceae bacterium]